MTQINNYQYACALLSTMLMGFVVGCSLSSFLLFSDARKSKQDEP